MDTAALAAVLASLAAVLASLVALFRERRHAERCRRQIRELLVRVRRLERHQGELWYLLGGTPPSDEPSPESLK